MMKRIITAVTLLLIASSSSSSWSESNNLEGKYLCNSLSWTSFKLESSENSPNFEKVYPGTDYVPKDDTIYKLEVSKDKIERRSPKYKFVYSRPHQTFKNQDYVEGWTRSAPKDGRPGGFSTIRLMSDGLLTNVNNQGLWVTINRYKCRPDF